MTAGGVQAAELRSRLFSKAGRRLSWNVGDVFPSRALRHPMPQFLRHRNQPVRMERRKFYAIVVNRLLGNSRLLKQWRQLVFDAPGPGAA